MNEKKWISLCTGLCLILFLAGCGASNKKAESTEPIVTRPPAETSAPEKQKKTHAPMKDKKGFKLKPLDMDVTGGRPYMPVGAEILSKGAPVTLAEVIKQLADLKRFSLTWAADVDNSQLVDVQITPEDNYWEALDNVLRQLDYFYEMENDTIVVRYKETQRYQLIMPTLKEDFKTSVGGALIGGGAVEGRITGKTEVNANIRKPFDFWADLENNLKQIIQSGERKTAPKAKGGGSKAASNKGFYILDRHVGTITVTAPRETQDRVQTYLKHLKSKIYKQVVIEARIMEVRLDDSHQMGINWSNILSVANRGNSETMGGTLNFGEAWERAGGEVLSSVVYPTHKLLNFMTLNAQSFSLAIEALKTYGKTNVLSNPKIALMNGHGASITVGEDITYIDKVTSTTDENGNVTYTVTTGSVLSGLGLAVMANIVDDKEVILYVVPVTSELQPAPNGDDIEYRAFGGAQVGLPRVRLRELATMSRIRDGETLIIGGHIDKVKGNTTNSVPILGDIPGLGWLFKHDAQTTTTRELVIFLTPKIIGS